MQARYRIQPYAGSFDETRAHRFGAETLHELPVFQHMGEPLNTTGALPPTGSLMTLPEGPVTVLHIKRAADGNGVVIRLLNASDTAQTAVIGSDLLTIQAASQCDLLERPLQDLTVENGVVTVTLPGRGLATIQCRS